MPLTETRLVITCPRTGESAEEIIDNDFIPVLESMGYVLKMVRPFISGGDFLSLTKAENRFSDMVGGSFD